MSELTPKEAIEIIERWQAVEALKCEAQLAEVFNRLKKALEQSRKGEAIDLPEEWFELFSAIQNDAIANVEQARKDERERIIKEIGQYAFAEPQYIPQSGREPVTICLTDSDLQALKGGRRCYTEFRIVELVRGGKGRRPVQRKPVKRQAGV